MSKVIYITDPLCGWCWAGAPLVDATYQACKQTDVPFELLHRALFTGEMTRWMSNSFSDYVMQADQRISDLSGQTFSAAYRENLLYNSSLIFDSWPTALAMAAVTKLAPARELAYLKALQQLRFEEGKVISDSSVMVDAATRIGIAAIDFHRALTYDQTLTTTARQTQKRAIELQHRVMSQGVPCLLLERDDQLTQLPHESFFADPLGFHDLLMSQLS